MNTSSKIKIGDLYLVTHRDSSFMKPFVGRVTKVGKKFFAVNDLRFKIADGTYADYEGLGEQYPPRYIAERYKR